MMRRMRMAEDQLRLILEDEHTLTIVNENEEERSATTRDLDDLMDFVRKYKAYELTVLIDSPETAWDEHRWFILDVFADEEDDMIPLWGEAASEYVA